MAKYLISNPSAAMAVPDAERKTVGRDAHAMRRILRNRLATAHEVVYGYRDCIVISFSPNGHGYEGVFAIRAGADGAKLYFNRGKSLPDPGKLLQGSGTQVRWILAESASSLARPADASLIDEAIAGNDVPFAATGSGPLVLRPTSVKKQSATPKPDAQPSSDRGDA